MTATRIVGRGTCQTEALLLAAIDQLAPPPPNVDLARLASPVRVVVPSRSLREHLVARVVRQRRCAVLGVTVQTLFSLATEICVATDTKLQRGDELFAILVRRAARQQPQLSRELGHLTDGFDAVVATARDLIDAGLTDRDVRRFVARLNKLDPRRASRQAVSRALEIVRVAERVLRDLVKLQLHTRPQVLHRAAELTADFELVRPSRAILVYGFADATGAANQLLRALLRHHDARIFVDLPADPADQRRLAPGTPFVERFLTRLEPPQVEPEPPFVDEQAFIDTQSFDFVDTAWQSAAMADEASPRAYRALPPRVVRARGAVAEMRTIALHIRSLLERGVRPEDVAVVGRNFDPYRAALRGQFTRIGIPFSGVGERGFGGCAARRAAAVFTVLNDLDATPTERWLDAATNVGERPLQAAADLRLGLFTLGAARLADVAKLDPGDRLDRDDQLALPVRLGIWAADSEDDGERPAARAIRRRLDGSELRRWVRLALNIQTRLQRWPGSTTVRRHSLLLAEMCVQDLRFDRSASCLGILDAIDRLQRKPFASFEATRDEVVSMLRRDVDESSANPIGGSGGGVQVLSVTEARARTFAHMFVIGLNRNVFPRMVNEDALLPDSLRVQLTTVLPCLPIKRLSGHDEENYLFAQLLSAASESITLSWQVVDDAGKQRAPSPLVERLMMAEQPPGESEPALQINSVHTPRELAVQAALAGGRDALATVLPWALALQARDLGASVDDAHSCAEARLRALDEVEPVWSRKSRQEPPRLGPYFGFVGSSGDGGDRRSGDLYVTSVEQLAACGWQFLLQKLLRLEPMPDPIGVLPTIDPLLLGSIVHDVLEDVVNANMRSTRSHSEEAKLQTLAGPSPLAAVAWPEQDRLQELLRTASARAVRTAATAPVGMASLYVELAAGYLDAAKRMDWPWPHSTLQVVGAEVEGRVAVRGGANRTIRYRADRVDLHAGRVRLTDYKTGRPLADRATVAAVREALLRQVAVGQKLQPVAYALGAGSPDAEGRFLFLHPDAPEHARAPAARADDAELRAAFENAATSVFAAWETGALFPRLLEVEGDRESRRCSHCAVAEACMRNDSGARLRLVEWLNHWSAADARQTQLTPAERSLLDLWYLARPPVVPEDADAD